MPGPSVILDPAWRRMDELFSPATLDDLSVQVSTIWARDEAMPLPQLAQALETAEFLVQAEPVITAETLAAAPRLRAVIEVSGGFPPSIDYAACAARDVEVLSCSPGFRRAVAEMALAMILSGARGLVAEHQNFETGTENWLADCDDRDFTLYGADIGFIGFGAIARETLGLLAPFGVTARAYDPWLTQADGATLTDLDTVLTQSRVVIVAAAPSRQNEGLINADAIKKMRKGTLLVVLSRAHLVDFGDLIAALEAGHIQAAIDVFPSEPLAADHPFRRMAGVILSPHRAAAVRGGRQQIGELILHDLKAIVSGDPTRTLAVADPAKIALTAGVGDAGGVAHFGGTQ